MSACVHGIDILSQGEAYIVTPEGVIHISRDCSSEPILTLSVAKFGILRAVHLTSCKLGVPLCLQRYVSLVPWCEAGRQGSLPS